MFSLIFYCGLITFVVSAHSNDTLDDGDKLNTSTTASTSPFKTILVSKDCVLEMTESEISQIVEHFNSNHVNVVDIHVSFSGTSQDRQLSDFHVVLMNLIGREIRNTLDHFDYLYVQWTLNAGIRNVKLDFNENQNNCIKREKNVFNFALENTQNIIRSINLATTYEVCSSYKETLSGKVNETCCQITKSNWTKFNFGCSKASSFLYWSIVPWIVVPLLMFSFAHVCIMCLLFAWWSRTEFELRYPKYYKLEESRMSPSFIVFKILWEENGHVVSFLRSCVLIGVFSYCIFLLCWSVKTLNVIMQILLYVWGLSFSISDLYRTKITDPSILLSNLERERNRWVNDFHFPLKYFRSGELNFAKLIKILALPFNINCWKRIIKRFNLFTTFTRRIRNRNRIVKMFALCTFFIVAVLICFLIVCAAFPFLLFSVFAFSFALLTAMVGWIKNLEYRSVDSGSLRFVWFHVYAFLFFLNYALMAMIYTIQPFLLGLFLNLIYFIPYFAFFSVLTYYCCSYWKSMEEEYLVLKRLINKAYLEKQCLVNNGCITNRHPERKEKVLPVLSKELYDTIRKELLPYDINLFYFGLKIFWSFACSFSIFMLINMLNESNITDVVQVVTTASLGIMPHVFNMVGLKTSEERKKDWEAKLNINVKFKLEELVSETSERFLTGLVRQEEYQIDTTNENPTYRYGVEDPELGEVPVMHDDINTTDVENVQGSSGLNHVRDNDDVEELEQAGFVIVGDVNDTTERVQARSDNDDVIGIVEEIIERETIL